MHSEWIMKGVDIMLHLDRYLELLIQEYHQWTYIILFVVIFCETGLVVTPFLPGDSLLFASGALAATGAMNPVILFILLSIAAILGDTVNYWIGYAVGPRVFKEKVRFLKKEYLDRTHAFYEKYGGKTIVIARFVPIIRTFAPFVAGIGKMSYGKFIFYNITGGIAWVAIFIFGGDFFGNLPVVKRNFSLVILVIIILSVMPGIIEYLKHRKEKKS
ncbi:MAG: DedA family protein [Candidatus Aureabacteria bacterium]|nr:DedA family protein [Candidatus Auribacterota bacterium]